MTTRALAVGALFLFVAAGPALAAGPTTLSVASGSEVWLRGETNLTGWQCHGVELSGALTLAADRGQLEELLASLDDAAHGGEELMQQGAPTLPPLPDLRPTLGLAIPVASLDCGRRAMERDVWNTLRGEQFPLITFAFHSVQEALLFPGSDGEPVRYRLRVQGDLELAGTRRPVELTVTGLRDGADRFRFYASLPLAMSDFGLQPPVALFGLVRARDELTVAVTLVLSATPDG